MTLFVFNISSILLAETLARGSIIEIIDIIKKAIIICIVYWIKAIISPTCIFPASTAYAPFQIIKIQIPFIIRVIIGIIKAITLLTKRLFLVKSLLALSNLFSSCFSLLKALITGKPVSISLVTKFNLSTKVWKILNFGITIPNKVITKVKIAITPTAIIHAIELLAFKLFMTPPTPIIGA